MKNIILLLFLCFAYNSFAQTNEVAFFYKVPMIKNTTLAKSNNINAFNTKKWYAISNQIILENLFGIVNNTNVDGIAVSNIKTLGWWESTKGKVAYIYAYDVKENNKKITQVFISSFIDNQKGNDFNIFEILPNPTGMKGKITVTQKCTVNEKGAITATQIHKSSNGKVLNITKSFFISEDGKLKETN